LSPTATAGLGGAAAGAVAGAATAGRGGAVSGARIDASKISGAGITEASKISANGPKPPTGPANNTMVGGRGGAGMMPGGGAGGGEKATKREKVETAFPDANLTGVSATRDAVDSGLVGRD